MTVIADALGPDHHDGSVAASGRPFRIDAGGDVASGPLDFEAAAIRAERDGYDGVLVSQTKHDPFVALTLGARATDRVQLPSAIAVAFARSPMTTAMLANDVQLVSSGRFVMGLGTRGHRRRAGR